MFFCPNCDNIYDIAKNASGNKSNSTISETPETVSSMTNSDKNDIENNDVLDDNINYNASFICKYCGNTEPIKPQTILIKKLYKTIINETNESSHYENMSNVDYYPRTRKYVCHNTKCKSHDNFEEREAIFYRISGSFKIQYICTSCKASWTN